MSYLSSSSQSCRTSAGVTQPSRLLDSALPLQCLAQTTPSSFQSCCSRHLAQGRLAQLLPFPVDETFVVLCAGWWAPGGDDPREPAVTPHHPGIVLGDTLHTTTLGLACPAAPTSSPGWDVDLIEKQELGCCQPVPRWS